MFLSANIASADSNNYYNGTNVTNGNGTDQCQSASSPCAYTSHGTFTVGSGSNTLNFTNSQLNLGSNYTLTAKGVTINVTASSTTNAIDVNQKYVTLNLINSYLKFEDNATAMTQGNFHFLRLQNPSARLTATFNGGIGTETIKNQQYNNVAFYGLMYIYKTNNNQNTIKFENGANMVGWLRNSASAGKVLNNVTFKGGGNLIAIDKNHYTTKWDSDNAKGKAITLEITSATDTQQSSQVTINFGESGKVETVSDTDKTTLLDKDGVVVGDISGNKVTSETTVSSGKTLITNAIRGDIYVAGYKGSAGKDSDANLTLNFYNNGLIDGAISTSSVANIKIYFANKGTIRSNLVFGM
ncbi:hypothetical protein CQA57_07830, partial [Helicobacter anseris]